MDPGPEDRLSATRARADIPTLLLFGGAGLSAFFGGYQLLETYFLIPRFGTHTLYVMHMLRGITAPAARRLGIDASTLYRRMKELELQAE